MLFVLIAWCLGTLLGFVMFVPGFMWRLRKILAVMAMFFMGMAASVLLLWKCNLFTLALFWLSLYHVINYMRLVKGRMHERYLRRSTVRTSLLLFFVQGLVVLGWLAWNQWHTTGHTTWTVVAVMQLVAAAVSLFFMLRTIQRTSWPAAQKHYTDGELPTLSVAIPARNETDDLQDCLRSLVASDYPKLEILVLDDCSQTKRTPEIIRSFAHDGVRFLQGEQPQPTWLAKNQAYEHLLRESNGQYILFCGVDVRFAPDSLRKLVSLMLARGKIMASVLPVRSPQAYGTTSLIQAMRYWWELVPPRRLLKRPPVLSTCWIMERKALAGAGGFKSVARSIVPEAHFARYAARTQDGYSFWRAGLGIGIQSVKTVADQRDTAIRMRYPQVHRRPEQVAIHSFLEMFFLLLPFALSLGGFVFDIGTLAQVTATLTCLLLVVIHELVVLSTKVNTWWFGLVAPPFMILTDVALLHYSMWKYEFSIVEWKGRNVCIPAMHVVPRLPSY